MSENPVKQILGDLLPYFESLEAQSSAILQLLRDKHIASDEELNRYMEQAGDASSVKWRAARVRMEHLLAVSPDPTMAPKTETLEEREVKNTDDRSGTRPDGVEADSPGTAVTNNAANQSNSSDQAAPVSKKASDNASNQEPEDATAETKHSSKPNAEKTKPKSNAEKDAA